MKRKRAALYNPYLNSMGGGEKHTLAIIKILQQEGYDISIFWDNSITEEIKNKLGITFKKDPEYISGIFPEASLMKKLQILSGFDIFIYVTDGSYFFSSAKKNYIFCMVPQKSLFNVTLENPLNFFKTKNYNFISNSEYTQNHLETWGIRSSVLPPFVDDAFIDTDATAQKKSPIILSVGRFFKQLHSKRQDISINAFKKLKQKSELFQKFTLILAGGLTQQNNEYFDELQTLAKDDSHIIFKPNIPYGELLELYKNSMLYWHCAGYGVDTEKHPENVEHFGISPIEAMASGCITFCYNAGGPSLFIEDAVNGYLFNNTDELISKTIDSITNIEDQKIMRKNAQQFVESTYSYKVFKQNAKDLFT